MSASAHAVPAVALSCAPDRAGQTLVFPYALTNPGPGDVFVAEAYPRTDPATRRASADRDSATILLQPDGDALVLRGAPPLPPGLTAAAPVRPLMARVAAGQTIQRTLTVPTPLAETSPYRPYGNVRDYVQAPINGVTLAVDWIPAGAEALVATQPDWADGLFTVHAANLARDTRRASCRFPTTGLSILRRKD